MVATSTKRVKLATLLRRLDACDDAREWAGSFGASREEYRRAWDECEHGGWLLWIARRRRNVSMRLIVRAACGCAREALKHLPAGEDRPRVTIETAERWCDGQASIKDVRAACDASWQCRREPWPGDAAHAAADAASYAASSGVAAAAASAADAAADAAGSGAAADDARRESYKRSAEIVRSVIPFDLIDPLI